MQTFEVDIVYMSSLWVWFTALLSAVGCGGELCDTDVYTLVYNNGSGIPSVRKNTHRLSIPMKSSLIIDSNERL